MNAHVARFALQDFGTSNSLRVGLGSERIFREILSTRWQRFVRLQQPTRPHQTTRFGSEIDVWIDEEFGRAAVNGNEHSRFHLERFGSRPGHDCRQVMCKLKDHVWLPIYPRSLAGSEKLQRIDSVSAVGVWVGYVEIAMRGLVSKHHSPTKAVLHVNPFASTGKQEWTDRK